MSGEEKEKEDWVSEGRRLESSAAAVEFRRVVAWLERAAAVPADRSWASTRIRFSWEWGCRPEYGSRVVESLGAEDKLMEPSLSFGTAKMGPGGGNIS